MNHMSDKGVLRPKFIELLKRQSPADREAKSRQIADQLLALPAFQQAKTVLFYASLPGEVDTFAMIKQAIQLKKQVALPALERDQRKMIPTLTDSVDDLHLGAYGILEPKPANARTLSLDALDCVVVPGLAFDRSNNRLGRGAGYYDRFLSSLDERTRTVGLAFDFQIVDRLPVEPHDMRLHHIIAK